ncbi:uncharacterized protein BO97DRAFT_306181, partial [Aspergillus homomorphus CBS 101889]
MKGTPRLNYAPWLKSLHPPLPRTPRQSKQLLNALTSSFRRQLDREYPSTRASTLDKLDVSEEQSPRNPESSSYATDKHLQTILENPLFRVKPPKEARAIRSERDSRVAKEPMVVFEELAAAGNVTEADLRNCLTSQLLILSGNFSGTEFVRAMKDSRTASRIASWWSASDSQSRRLLFHSEITPLITKFLVAENMQNMALDWLRSLAQQDIGGTNGQLTQRPARLWFSGLLNDLVLAEARYGRGIESAMRLYVSARSMSTPSGDLVIENGVWAPALLSAGGHLGQLITQNEPEHSNGVSQDLYDKYIQVIDTVAANSLLHACVCLHHPTQPDPMPYVKYARALQKGQVESWSRLRREHFMRAGFTAIRILFDKNLVRDATWLARYMQKTLSE